MKLYRQFLPRDAMHKRGLCCRPVTVCPSVTLVYCIHTAEDIVKRLSTPGSTIILVFWPPSPSADTQFQGQPLQRGCKIHRGNFAIFEWTRCLSRKRCKI